MKSKTTEVKSSSMSKRSTVSGKKSSKRSTEKSSSIGDEIYKKYNINERLIELIDEDENKIKIVLEEIYKKKLNELKELQRTPYTI